MKRTSNILLIFVIALLVVFVLATCQTIVNSGGII